MGERLEQNSPIEKKEGPRRIFIEIGTGRLPVSAQGDKQFSQNDYYIGLDDDLRELVPGRDNARRWTSFKKEQGVFIAADAEKLPVAAESADEVFLGNVLEDPQVWKKGRWGEILKPARLLQEIRRILKPDGILIIKGDNTPRSITSVTEFLTFEGFVVDRAVVPTDPDWVEKIAAYSNAEYGSAEHPNPNGYLIYSSKRQESETSPILQPPQEPTVGPKQEVA